MGGAPHLRRRSFLVLYCRSREGRLVAIGKERRAIGKSPQVRLAAKYPRNVLVSCGSRPEPAVRFIAVGG